MAELAISVRELANFCYRSGDIDYRFTPSPTGAQGIEGHQRLFARRPASYQSEYSIDYRVPGELHLRGRADGYDADSALVEEIKTCRVDPATLPESISRLHLAQARLYAGMIAAREGTDALTVRLTWYQLDDDIETALDQEYSKEELLAFLEHTLEAFSQWRQRLARLRQQRDDSLRGKAFPYSGFRPGQRDLAELGYKCIAQGGQLLLEAPTGMGKTAALLFPALQALVTGKHDRIAFLTAKSVGRRAAEDTLAHFQAAGLQGKALSLTARDKVCLSPGKACHGDDCPYADGYYDKLPAAMARAMEAPALTRDELDRIARELVVCPYQLAVDLLPWVDMVIADVNYVYSLTPVLGNQMDSDDRRWSVLVDEAHNLPGRARAMYSVELAKTSLMEARSEAPTALRKALSRVNNALLALQKEDWLEAGFDSRRELPAALLDSLARLVADCAAAQAADAFVLQRRPRLMACYFDVLQFLRVAEHWGEDYRFEMTRGEGKQSLELRLNCLDPARLLGARQERLHAVTAFSATLSPGSWVQAGLGMREDAVYRQLASPFEAGQLRAYVATHIDTRYGQREGSLPALANTLVSWLADEPGNCIVYFPSYRYLADCLELLESSAALPLDRRLWVQTREQDERAREALLTTLGEHRNVVAFCILGGVFGEGVDLPGEQLASVVIVGVGLPQVNRDTRQLQDYYDRRCGQGFEYTFLYPGMQKVDQALGRVIRRDEDRGSALLIDSRYRRHAYRVLLPGAWHYVDYRLSPSWSPSLPPEE